MEELDIVILKRALTEYNLESGDVGTVVHLYRDGTMLEVEFVTGEGNTVAVLTLESRDVRIMNRKKSCTYVR